jgi:hypothetical protein
MSNQRLFFEGQTIQWPIERPKILYKIPSKRLTIGYHEFHWQEFEYNKGVIRIRKSKDRKHNDQKKKDKRPNNDLQNIHIKLKIE